MWIGFLWVFMQGLGCLVDASTVRNIPRRFDCESTLLRPRGGSVSSAPPKIRRTGESTDRMPSLFSPQEDRYDRYAACLAATEGLRRIRDRDLAEAVQVQGQTGDEMIEGKRRITTEYIRNSAKVLRVMGMTVKEFNEMGREIAKDEKMKQKIMEQAYLYRMAATISMDRTPLMEDPTSADLLDAFRRDKVRMFCESMTEIETLRAGQIDRLKKSLHVDSLPAHINISDPTLMPFLSAKVRAVVEAFPLQAEAIVRKHGLESEEFNKMLQATKSNPIFRWKIQKQMKLD